MELNRKKISRFLTAIFSKFNMVIDRPKRSFWSLYGSRSCQKVHTLGIRIVQTFKNSSIMFATLTDSHYPFQQVVEKSTSKMSPFPFSISLSCHAQLEKKHSLCHSPSLSFTSKISFIALPKPACLRRVTVNLLPTSTIAMWANDTNFFHFFFASSLVMMMMKKRREKNTSFHLNFFHAD